MPDHYLDKTLQQILQKAIDDLNSGELKADDGMLLLFFDTPKEGKYSYNRRVGGFESQSEMIRHLEWAKLHEWQSFIDGTVADDYTADDIDDE